MDTKQWIDDLRSQIEALEKVLPTSQAGRNRLLPAQDMELIEVIENQNQVKLSKEFVDFYIYCGGVDLLDVHNGYFIFPLNRITRARELMMPTEMTGVNSGAVIPIGSDDGLGYFVMRTDETGQILYLPEGLIENGVYMNTRGRDRLIASDFSEFLAKLLEDVKAFASQDTAWSYMI